MLLIVNKSNSQAWDKNKTKNIEFFSIIFLIGMGKDKRGKVCWGVAGKR